MSIEPSWPISMVPDWPIAPSVPPVALACPKFGGGGNPVAHAVFDEATDPLPLDAAALSLDAAVLSLDAIVARSFITACASVIIVAAGSVTLVEPLVVAALLPAVEDEPRPDSVASRACRSVIN